MCEKIKPVTNEQMKALKLYVALSQDATEFAKKTLIYLLDQSQNLTKPLIMILPDTPLGRKVQNGAHAMNGSCCSTHLGCMFDLMGSPIFLGLAGLKIWLGTSAMYPDQNAITIHMKPEAKQIRDQTVSPEEIQTIELPSLLPKR